MEVIIDGVKYVPSPDVPTGNGLLDALEVRFSSDAGDDITIRDYLHTLLMKLWYEGEGFSGKRPFGNSGWEFNLYAPLIKGGFISGSLDDDRYVQEYDKKLAKAYVGELIKAAFYGVKDESRNLPT